MKKNDPTVVDSIVVSRATACLEEAVAGELSSKDEDINILLKDNNEDTE